MELLFIIFLLLLLLLLPVIKAAFKIWMQVRQMNRSFRDAQSQFSGSRSRNQGGNRNNNSNNGRHRHSRRGKIFGPGDGEYVEFEEIIEQRQSVRYVEVRDTEPRITDAKFEDL